MSNINVIKETGPDQNLPEWPEKRYGSGRLIAQRMPFLVQLAHLPPLSVAIIAVFVLLVVLFVWRWRAVWCYDNPISCAEQSDLIWRAAIPGAALMGAVLVAHRLLIALRGSEAEADQKRILFDRFGNPVDVRVFTEPALLDRTKAAVLALQEASDLEETIAPHKRYSGINTLTEGAHSNVSTEMSLPPKAELLPAPKGDQTLIEALKERGHIDRSGHSLLVGYDEQQTPSYLEMKETGFIAVAGHPRSGKTSTVQLLLAQAALQGWEVFACDKHGHKEHGLLSRCAPIAKTLAQTAIDVGDIVRTVERWHQIVQARLSDAHDREYHRLLLVIDEFTALILSQQLPAATLHQLISAAVEAPKVQAHGLIIGHQWSERLLGKYGANLRRVITARIVHRSDPDDAAFLLPSGYAKQTLELATGSVIAFGNGAAPAQLSIPYLQKADLEWVAQHAPTSAASMAPSVRPSAPDPPQHATDGRTDSGRTVYTQDKIKRYLLHLARQGRSREWAREWVQNHGLHFENRLWTEALEEARKIEAL